MGGRPARPPYGPYDAYEVTSALRKTIKLGLVEDAIYWTNVILTYGEKAGPASIARQLWIMAAEDIDDPMIVLRAYAVAKMVTSVPETDHLFYLVAAMCRARKWWETEEGREVDRLWSKAIGDLKSSGRRKPIPEYALDRHTRRGWQKFRETGHFDDRFSGTTTGRAKTEFLFLRDGKLDPDAPFDHDDPEFLKVWRERRQLEARGRGDTDADDPLAAELGEAVMTEDPCLFDSDAYPSGGA